MDSFFTFNENVEQFVLFSRVHIITISIIIMSYIILFLSRNKLRNKKVDKVARYILAFLTLTSELSIHIYRIYRGTWSLSESLPLHLCSFLVVTTALLAITKNYTLYEFSYLLGVAGTTQAILTPTVEFSYPHFRYYQFFLAHGLIIFIVLYITFVHNYRPKFKSLYKIFLLLNIILPFIGIINYLTGGNYMFLARKPESASLIDYLGQWPWYIISLEILAAIFLLIAYLPIAVENYMKRRNSSELVEESSV